MENSRLASWPERAVKRRRPPARAVAARVPDVLADEFFVIAGRIGVNRNDVIKEAVERFVAQHREQVPAGQDVA